MPHASKTAILSAAVVGVLPLVAFSAVTVDGTVDFGGNEYSNTLSLQSTPTQFGDNFSELDGAYSNYTPGSTLDLAITGNLEPSNPNDFNAKSNGFVLWMDRASGGGVAGTVPGSSNILGGISGRFSDDWGADTDPGAGVFTPTGGASILSPGFNPDLAIEVEHYGPNNAIYIHVIDLTVPNSDASINRDVYLGTNTPGGPQQDDTYYRDNGNTDAGHVLHAFNNSNTVGVTDSDASGANTASTGFEFQFSPEFLARQNGHAIRLMGFITNPDGNYLSNQFLPTIGGWGNLGNPGGDGGDPLFDSRGFHFNEMYLTVWEPTWQAGDGQWSAAANWEGTFSPNGADHSAKFGAAGPHNVTLASNVTLGTLKFDDSSSYAIGSNGDGRTIAMDAGLAAGRIDVFQGSHTVHSTLKFNSDTLINMAATTLTLKGVDNTAGKTVVLRGIGLLNIDGPQNNGVGASLAIDGGSASMNADAGSPSSSNLHVFVSNDFGGNGIMTFGSTQHLEELTINPNGHVNLTNGPKVIVANAFAVDPNSDLNLNQGTLIARNGNRAAIEALVTTGRGPIGDWTGTGITSSAAAALAATATHSLGVISASDAAYENLGFAGQTVNGSDVLVKYTYNGDANLDGVVNPDDFQKFLAGFNTPLANPARWFTGDFNYDGVVNPDDFQKFLAGYNYFNGHGQVALSGSDLAEFATAEGIALVLDSSPAPEPTSTAIVLGTSMLLMRRRRRS